MSPANKTLWSICLVLSSFSILPLYSLTVVLSSPKVPLFIGLSEICTQIGYVIGVAEPTIQELVSRIPDEIVEIVGRFLTDEEVNTDHIDVQEMMPSQQCVDLIANHLGLSNDDVGTAELDQAKAWLDEQASWQDRSYAVQKKLSEKYPFAEEQALKGEIPMWFYAKWAPKLLFAWSEGLRDAVVQAEEYLTEIEEDENE